MALAVRLSVPFSNARPETDNPYRAARARTIPDKYRQVKYLPEKLASFLPVPARVGAKARYAASQRIWKIDSE